MRFARVKNWSKFQHYKDRSPPWIKLQKELLDDFEFACLPIASKALAPLMWLLASETLDGDVRIDADWLAFRLRLSISDVNAGLVPLIEKGFFIPASKSLADCQQVAVPEAEAEAEAEAEITASAVHSEILSIYHERLPGCQRISVLNPKRRKRIDAVVKLARSVCRDQGWPYASANFWQAYFGECAKDAWMRGEVPNPKNPAWRQKLEHLIAEDRFAEVMDKAIASMRSAV